MPRRRCREVDGSAERRMGVPRGGWGAERRMGCREADVPTEGGGALADGNHPPPAVAACVMKPSSMDRLYYLYGMLVCNFYGRI